MIHLNLNFPHGNKGFHFLRCQKQHQAIEEIVMSLYLYGTSHKVEVIHQQLRSMSTSALSEELYGPEEIVRAFSYFATSRSLYKQMRGRLPISLYQFFKLR